MANIDAFIPDLGPRPGRAPRRRLPRLWDRSMRIARRAALGLAGLVTLIGAGAGAITVANWQAVAPADDSGLHQQAMSANQREAIATADVTTASIAPAGTGAAVAQVAPARLTEPQRAAKSDLLPLWPQRKRPAPSPRAEPDPPIAAARQVVADIAQDAPVPQAARPDPNTQQSPDGLPAPETANLTPVSEADSDSGGEAELDDASEPQAAEASHTAPVKSDVNMRARPDNSAAVITVVPGGSRVEVIDCDYWCEVDFSGKRGWIYKSFIRGAS